MKIVCSSSVLLGQEAFSSLGETLVVPEAALSKGLLQDTDALITRSTVKLGPDLLDGTNVSFVGTATAGIDHLDTAFLDEVGIAWASAPGCNANSVSEYVTTAILGLLQKHGLLLEDLTLGVIGAGHTGSAVAEKAEALGLRVLLNDPPRALAEESDAFVSLDELLEQSDIISLHVPLTDRGPFATRHLVDYCFLEKVRPGVLLVHACRGAVVDTDALLLALERGVVLDVTIDVWEGEPGFRLDLLERAQFATPHIAGYSWEGKLRGTMMVYREASGFFECEASFTPQSVGGEPARQDLVIDGRARLPEDVLWELTGAAYDLLGDDQRLREGAVSDEAARASFFSGLRRQYPVRHEFTFFRAHMQHCSDDLVRQATGLGFDVVLDS